MSTNRFAWDYFFRLLKEAPEDDTSVHISFTFWGDPPPALAEYLEERKGHPGDDIRIYVEQPHTAPPTRCELIEAWCHRLIRRLIGRY